MLLKSKSRTAPTSDAASALRARADRYVRRRSAFQRSSQSTCIEPGEGIVWGIGHPRVGWRGGGSATDVSLPSASTIVQASFNETLQSPRLACAAERGPAAYDGADHMSRR